MPLAKWHRLLPILHAAVPLQIDVPAPSAAVAKILETAYRQNLGQGLLQRSDLKSLLEAFADRGIRTIVLKGVATEDDLYPRPGLRPSTDVDVMVPRSQLPVGERVLESLGYIPAGDDARKEAFELHHHHLIPYFHPRTRTVVEVHRQPLNPDGPFGIDADAWWAGVEGGDLAGTPYLKLSPEDHLLYLSLHFMSDRQYSRGSALRQLCDISLILNRFPHKVDWEEFADRVLKHHVGPAVYAAMYASALVTGSLLPHPVSLRIRPVDFDEDKARLFVISRVIRSGREAPVGLSEALALPGRSARVRGAMQSLRPPTPRFTPGAVSRGSFLAGWRALALRPLQLIWGAAKLVPRIGYLKEQVVVEGWMAKVCGQTKEARLGIMPATTGDPNLGGITPTPRRHST